MERVRIKRHAILRGQTRSATGRFTDPALIHSNIDFVLMR